MRTLRFKVNNQIIEQDSDCDFSGLVPGTEGYLKAEFEFSSEWDGCVKVAAFYSAMGHEYEPQVLTGGKICVIPAEALKNQVFKIRVVGGKPDYRITTNKVTVRQNGGKV